MDKEQDIWEFIRENKLLLQEYVEVRVRILKLELIRTTSSIGGILTWLIISLFMFFLVILFAGITLGLWVGKMMDNYVAGFGITTLLFLLLMLLLTIFRKKLFINPIVKILIKQNEYE